MLLARNHAIAFYYGIHNPLSLYTTCLGIEILCSPFKVDIYGGRGNDILEEARLLEMIV